MPKIPRKARIATKSSFYHIIVQGLNKEYIFSEKRFREKYLQLFQKNSIEYKITIIAYCIMSNHAHFLVKVKEIKEMSALMKKINYLYARYYNQQQERVGYVFRDRYVSEPITSKRYLIQCIKYIHLNPVKAKIVERCEDYPYSSYIQFRNQNKWNKETKAILNQEDCEDICDHIDYTEVFLDVEKNDKEKSQKAIEHYIRMKKVNAVQIIEKRESLQELIQYMKEAKKISYEEIKKALEISRGTLEKLKLKDGYQ